MPHRQYACALETPVATDPIFRAGTQAQSFGGDCEQFPPSDQTCFSYLARGIRILATKNRNLSLLFPDNRLIYFPPANSPQKRVCTQTNNNNLKNMKLKNLAIIAAALALAVTANAQPITTFTNIDFDLGGVSSGGNFNGFDNPNCEIIGWNNNAGLFDAGVEGPGAWWGPYQDKAAFMNGGGSAFNLSDYTIQPGDSFALSFMAQSWQWTGANGQWTATLFYDNPANVIGSYTTPGQLPENWQPWGAYTSDAISATPASVGGHLGILISNTGTRIAQIDEITVVVPEPTTFSLVAVAGLGLLLKRRSK